METEMSVVVLVGITVGLTELIKRAFGLKDVVVQAIGTAIGTVSFVLSSYSLAPLATFTDWFNAVGLGLVLGLTTVGLYSVGMNTAKKAGGAP